MPPLLCLVRWGGLPQMHMLFDVGGMGLAGLRQLEGGGDTQRGLARRCHSHSSPDHREMPALASQTGAGSDMQPVHVQRSGWLGSSTKFRVLIRRTAEYANVSDCESEGHAEQGRAAIALDAQAHTTSCTEERRAGGRGGSITSFSENQESPLRGAAMTSGAHRRLFAYAHLPYPACSDAAIMTQRQSFHKKHHHKMQLQHAQTQEPASH